MSSNFITYVILMYGVHAIWQSTINRPQRHSDTARERRVKLVGVMGDDERTNGSAPGSRTLDDLLAQSYVDAANKKRASVLIEEAEALMNNQPHHRTQHKEEEDSAGEVR